MSVSSSSSSAGTVTGGKPTTKQLALAARDGKIEDIVHYIKLGISVNEITEFGGTALHQAAQYNETGAMEILIAAGANIDTTTSPGLYSSLHIACEKNKVEAVELLLQNNSNIEAKTQHGRTPLHIAAAAGSADCIRVLLTKGAQINALDNENRTPLILAAKYGHVESVKNLLKYGKPNSKSADAHHHTAIDAARHCDNKNVRSTIEDLIIDYEIDNGL